MGTSLPECAVSVTASLTGNNPSSISNAVGPTFFNLFSSLRCSVLYSSRLLYRKVLYRKNSRYLSSVRDFLLLLGYLGMTLGRIDGIIFLIIFAGYLLWMIRSAKRARHNITSADSSSATKSEKHHFPKKKSRRLPPISTSFRYGNVSFHYWAV